MDKFWAWWALVFYILPVMIAIPFIRKRRRGVNNMLTGVALRYGGAIKSIIGIPYYVGFELDGISLSLSLSHGSRNSPQQTLITSDLRMKMPVTLWVGPENNLAEFGKRLGLQDIEVMQPEFDKQFLVQGKDENFVRRLLDDKVQDLLLKWRDVHASLYIRDNKFRFTVYELIQDEERLDDLITDAHQLVQKISEPG